MYLFASCGFPLSPGSMTKNVIKREVGRILGTKSDYKDCQKYHAVRPGITPPQVPALSNTVGGVEPAVFYGYIMFYGLLTSYPNGANISVVVHRNPFARTAYVNFG